ncbi:hypothetical protein GCM10022408_35190 [Hymenobacter fastidiosus]|uniref:Secretion system C-terminal sorting domain-containing protein n=1 Tax=Hymenobacter fastidiosus TaxID=486264 RepID=A0ABP7SYS4_9BACT
MAARGASTLVTLPGRGVTHFWDQQTNRWGYASIFTYTYDAKGKPTQVILADSATNAPQRKQILAYNAQGLLTEELFQNWNGSAYVNFGRDQYSYDVRNREILFLHQDWQNNAWVMRYGNRSTNTYNPAGVLTSEVYESWDSATSSWKPDGRTTYTVNAGNQWSAVLEQDWENGAYVNEYRAYNIIWYNWTKLLPSSFEEQAWDGSTNTWTDDHRSTLTYQPNGSYVMVSQLLTAPATWVNEYRSTYTLDNFGNLLLSQGEEWLSNSWVIEYAYRQLLSYTAANVVRRAVGQSYDNSLSSYVNLTVSTYGNFITLGTRRARELEAATALYPNPARQSAMLRVAGLREQEAVRTEILNPLGQVVKVLSLRPQQGVIEQELDLAALPAGLYTIRLYTAEGTVAKRVMKQ